MDSSLTDAPPLALAHATLRLTHASLHALSHVVSLVSQYLDPSPHTSLDFAAASRSTRLFGRVASRVVNDSQLHDAVHDNAFTLAKRVAIKNDDLRMVKRIHAFHPEPVVLKTLRTAMEFGSLEMVQWVIKYRHDRLCCPPGVGSLCESCLQSAVGSIGMKDPYRIVRWLVDRGFSQASIVGSSCQGSPLSMSLDLTRWLNETRHLTQEMMKNLFHGVVMGASVDDRIVQYLVETGYTSDEESLKRTLIRASLLPNKQNVVEYIVGSPLCDPIRHKFEYASVRPGGAKIIQWSVDHLQPDEYSLYSHRVEGVRWLYEKLPLARARLDQIYGYDEQELLDLYEWLHATKRGNWCSDLTKKAATFGSLQVLQWLQLHLRECITAALRPMDAAGNRREYFQWLDADRCFSSSAMDVAAAKGHLHVVQWLHANRTEGCTAKALTEAATNGHLEVVQWLCYHRMEGCTATAMAAAAACGQLEILIWLHENRGDGCTACCLRCVLHDPHKSMGIHGEMLPVINTLKWLCTQSTETTCLGDCIGIRNGAMPLFSEAIATDLQLIEY